MTLSPAVRLRSAVTTLEAPGGEATDRRERLEILRRRIEQIQARHRRTVARCSTGFPELDEALAGGLPCGAVHELVGRGRAGGAQMLALHLALAVARSHHESAGIDPSSHRPILWLDPQETFYPPAAMEIGVRLDRLFVARGISRADRLWLAEQALRCAAMAAVVLPMRTIEPRCLRRLQLAAEAGGTVGLLVLEEPAAHGFAASRMVVEPRPAGDEPDGILAWVQFVRVRIERMQGGSPGREVELRLPLTAARRIRERGCEVPVRLPQTA